MIWLNRVCQVAWRFGRVPKVSANLASPFTKGRQEWMNQPPRHLFALFPRKSVCQDATKKLNQSWMIPRVVFVAAVILKKQFLLSSKFSRIPGMMPKIYTHALSISGKCMAWFFVKSFGGVTGVRCWRVPVAGRQETVFLIRKLCPRRRVKSQLFSFGVRLWQWCVLAALLCLYQDPLHNGSRAKSDLWSHFTRPPYVYSNWCAIAYVVSIKNFGEPWCIWIGWDSCRHLNKVVTVELQDEPFAFCGRNGAAYVDLLSRVFSTHLIGFLLRATKQERKSALKRLRYYVSPKECFLGRRPRQCFLQVNEKTLQQVETFKYLGMVVTSDGCRNK